MPLQRTPLGNRDVNITPGKHLSPYTRGFIAGAAKSGLRPSEIARELKCPDYTVRTTILLDVLYNEGATRPKKPRRKLYTEAEERKLLRYIRANLKDTYKQVKKAYRIAYSRSTLQKILLEYNIGN
jgi:hypothetical protein